MVQMYSWGRERSRGGREVDLVGGVELSGSSVYAMTRSRMIRSVRTIMSSLIQFFVFSRLLPRLAEPFARRVWWKQLF